MAQFGLSELQANAILELRLRRLTGLARKEVEDEFAELQARIGELRDAALRRGEDRRADQARSCSRSRRPTRRRDDRRTEIIAAEEELELEDLIADEKMVIAITRSGYIKRLPTTAYREQRRGGIGVMGMEMKEDDYIEHLFVASTHDYILFFTSVGKVYRLKVHELPLGSRQSKGRAIVNLLPFRQDEQVRAVIQTRNFQEAEYLLCATKNGVVKKTALAEYNTPLKADGIIAIKMREGDELVAVRHVSKGDDILLVSRKGQAIRFSEADARAMGRATEGVRGMTLRGDDEVIAAELARDDADLLVVTENGFGKRTRVSEYPRKGRGGMGVQTVKLTEARGYLAGARVVRDGYQVMLISTGGTVIKMPVEDVKRLGRSTQGVIVMRLRDGETVSSLAPVIDAADATPTATRTPRSSTRATFSSRRDEESSEESAVEEDEPSDEYAAPFTFWCAQVRFAPGVKTMDDHATTLAERGPVALEPVDVAEYIDGSSSTSGRCAAWPASRRCSSTTGRTRRRSRPRARSSGSTTSTRSRRCC